MLEKICEHCNTKFFLLKAGKKELKRRFCGPICSRRWAANNRSETWKQKASLAKQGENNPMFGISQVNPKSLANLNRNGSTGKQQSAESNEKRSNSMKGKSSWTEESKKKFIQTGIQQGRFWKADDSEYIEFKKYRRKVYYWTSKNDLTKLENYDKRGRSGYHLDHKYSIAEGFKNNVPPKVIGSIDNLEFLLYTDNVKKGTKCSIELEKLNELLAAVNRSL
jgi:hypothetical protein